MSQVYTWPPVLATNPSVGTNGAPAPTSSTEIGGVDLAGNLIPVSVDPSGNVNVNIVSLSPNPLPTSDAADGPASPGTASTKSIQIGAQYNTVLPTFANGQQGALQTDSNGRLIISPLSVPSTVIANQGLPSITANRWPVQLTDGTNLSLVSSGGGLIVSGLTAVGVTPVNNPVSVSGVDGGGLKRSFLTDTSGRIEIDTAQSLPLPAGASTSANQATIIANQTNGTQVTQVSQLPADKAPATQNITTQDLVSVNTTVANGQVFITGTPTAGSAASFAITSAEGLEVLVTGVWTGTLQSEISFDGGTTWITRGLKQSGSSYLSSSFTQNFQGGANLSGVTNYRVRATSAVTGTATVKIISSLNTASIIVSNPQSLRDGTVQSITNTIKAASTAPLATDTALVVTISPNSSLPLPSGAATAANQTNGNQKTQVVDGSGTVQGPFSTISGTNYAPVVLASSGTSGSAVPVRTLQIGGSDGTNLRTLSTDTSGRLAVDLFDGTGNSIGSTSGALNVNISGGGPSSDPSLGATFPPGTAGTKSSLAGMMYNSTITTPTNGQQLALTSDLFNNLQTVLPDMYITGAAAQTAIVSNILTSTSGAAAVDAVNYRSATVQVVSTGTAGTFIFEGSNDNVNFQTIPVYNQVITTGTIIVAAITASASQLIYTFPVQARYIRLRIVTTITGGSIQAFTKFSQISWSPSVVQATQNTSGSLLTTATLAANSIINNQINLLVADIASAAITTTTTTATISPATGVSYSVNIPVTVVSGTNPTLSVAIQESADTGTNWYTVYTFPTITATGSYNSPQLPLTGNRVRYVQTVTGTTPSFTRAVNRLQSNENISASYRNFIDTTINPTSTNSVTPSLFVENLSTYTAIVNQGSGGSAVTFALDGSDDNVNWVQNLTQVNGITGGTSPVTMTYNQSPFRFIRARVVTGVAATTIVGVTIIGSKGSDAGFIKASPGTLTDRSGTTSGTPSTSTQLAPANPSRKYLLIQNTGTDTLWINFTAAAAATQPSIQLPIGGGFVMEASFVSTEAVNILSASASISYTAKEA